MMPSGQTESLEEIRQQTGFIFKIPFLHRPDVFCSLIKQAHLGNSHLSIQLLLDIINCSSVTKGGQEMYPFEVDQLREEHLIHGMLGVKLPILPK